MKTVSLQYGVTFGHGDSSDWISYDFDLTDEEAVAYEDAVANGRDLNEEPALQGALRRAYEEIEENEIDLALDLDCEFVLECEGKVEMDTVELNDLVHRRDPHALAFFGLEDASDEEIEEWDANLLDEIPLICDFEEDFEPCSPYDAGWSLTVEFEEPWEWDEP